MKITKQQLRRIIKEEKVRPLSEMPVSKSRGAFSANVDKENPHLAAFAHEIDSAMEHWGYIANVQMFDSGYVGIKIEFTNDQGKPTKWLVVDQPGKVGMEDQSMGYIFFGPAGPIQKSNAWVWEQVPYHGRRFGDTNFRDTDREFAYSAILDVIEEKLSSPIRESKVKITKRQLKRIIKEEKANVLAEQKVRRIVRRRLMQEMGMDKFTYATDAQSPARPAEWEQWGKSLGLDVERDNSGQVIFYTDDPSVANDAERAGADVQRDNMGQFVIYTG